MSILKSPTAFFEQFDFESANRKTLIIGTACLCFGLIGDALNQFLLTFLASHFKAALEMVSLEQIELTRKIAWITLGTSPITAFCAIYLFAGALHITLKAFAQSAPHELRYESTLHLAALCQIPMVFTIIPLLGSLIASIWALILLIKGLKQAYGISAWLAFICSILPALLIKFCWGSALQLLALSL